MTIFGIDPGLTGAVAKIPENGGVVFFDTPICEVKKNKKNKKEYLPSQMAGIFSTEVECHVFIESVSSRPGQGVTSMFNFGFGFGLWIGILSALKISYTMVTPQFWKKNIMQGIGDKDAARLRAQQLFPELSISLARKKDIGRADALLIAEYGRRVLIN